MIFWLETRQFKVLKGDDDSSLSSSCAEIRETFSSPLEDILPNLRKYEQLCERTLDPDGIREGVYRINPRFDETLAGFKERLDELQERMYDVLAAETDRLGVDKKTVKLETNPQHGWHFRVTLKVRRTFFSIRH